MKRKIIFSTIALAFLVGCGGGGGSSNNSYSATLKGSFVDSYVKGLKYETLSGISGITDENGTFIYKSGDSVTFKIGNTLIGEVSGKNIVTPYDFGSDKASVIAYILQNLDSDGNVSNGIQLPSEELLSEVIKFSTLDDIKNNIENIKAQLKSKGEFHFADINETQALLNLNSYLEAKTTNPLIKEALEKGLLALKGKTVYWVYVDGLAEVDKGKATFSGDNIDIIINGNKEYNFDLIEINKNYFIDREPNKINKYTLIKVDSAKNLIFTKDNGGLLVFASSKEAIDNFVKELNNKYKKVAIDPKTLEGEYLYNMDDDKYEWLAVKLGDNDATIYKVDDIDELEDEDSYDYGWKEDVRYPGWNKFEYYDDGEWDKTEVYKYSLKNITLSAWEVGAMFDDINILTEKLKTLGIDNITFTKGNAYCNLLWEECWIDKDAMKEIADAFLNINYKFANIKGNPRTPRYSKISDYLKDNIYYSVYTEGEYLDYEKWYISGDKFVWQEIANSKNDSLDRGEENISQMDSFVKILAEYDNGILIEISYEGYHYKTFLYNNEEDAKKVYYKLLPKYFQE